MKSILKIFVGFVFLFIAAEITAQPVLEIVVKGIKEPKGSVRIGLFTNGEDFLKKAAEGRVVKVEGEEVTVVFEKLKRGNYGISVIHDENDNGELDTNIVGIPKEGFAFGNNAMGAFGPPAFDKAKVILSDSLVKQVIILKYF